MKFFITTSTSNGVKRPHKKAQGCPGNWYLDIDSLEELIQLQQQSNYPFIIDSDRDGTCDIEIYNEFRETNIRNPHNNSKLKKIKIS